MKERDFHVITGASGAGKSTLIAALSKLGYSTVPEAALAIMREQLQCGGTTLPSGDRTAFMKLVLRRSIKNFEEAQSQRAPVFFDRGIPEWLRFLNSDKDCCESASAHYRYANMVFVAEPWQEIYACDHERAHGFEKAFNAFAPTVAAYVQAGYQTCVIPKASVQERVAFILAQLNRG